MYALPIIGNYPSCVLPIFSICIRNCDYNTKYQLPIFGNCNTKFPLPIFGNYSIRNSHCPFSATYEIPIAHFRHRFAQTTHGHFRHPVIRNMYCPFSATVVYDITHCPFSATAIGNSHCLFSATVIRNSHCPFLKTALRNYALPIFDNYIILKIYCPFSETIVYEIPIAHFRQHTKFTLCPFSATIRNTYCPCSASVIPNLSFAHFKHTHFVNVLPIFGNCKTNLRVAHDRQL